MGNRIGTAVRQSAMALMVAALVLAGNASATLFDRGGGLIYDDNLNITWLQNANLSGTTMNWVDANVWAAGLNYFDSVRNVTWSDWRLPYASVSAGAGPTTLTYGQPCTGLAAGEAACRDNEMAYMFYYNLDGTFGSPEIGTQISDGVTLNNIQSDYWSGTEFDSTFPWNFFFGDGFQSRGFLQNSPLSAWAVRPGDVVAVIPEPEIYAMLGLGLGLMGWVGRRKKLQAAA